MLRHHFAVLGLLMLTLSAASHDAAAQGTDDERTRLGPEESRLLQLVNEYRARHHAPPLAPIPLLNAVAWDHSLDMAQRNYFAHEDPDGLSPFDRMERAGYGALAMGENLAAGYDDARHTFEQWRTSPSHNAAMLDPEYRGAGIGRVYAPGTSSEVYWTMDLGDEAPTQFSDVVSRPRRAARSSRRDPSDRAPSSPPSVDAPAPPSIVHLTPPAPRRAYAEIPRPHARRPRADRHVWFVDIPRADRP